MSNQRRYIQREASETARRKMSKLQKKYGLTDLELARILGSMQNAILYWAMRREQNEQRRPEFGRQADGD